jgi:hypothetical protein
MSTIDRAAIARRQLEELEDTDERIEAMLLGGLAKELIALLPLLIRDGRCELAYTGGCQHTFHGEGLPGQHLQLHIKDTRDEHAYHKLCFDGLLRDHGNSGIAASFVQQLMEAKNRETHHCYTEADAYAVRTCCAAWSFRGEIELLALVHALSNYSLLPVGAFIYPDESARNHMRLPAHQHLHQTRSELMRLGVKEDRIEQELLCVLSNCQENLKSLAKICAIAGAIQSQEGRESLRATITMITPLILRLHFNTRNQVVQAHQLSWLMKFSDCFHDFQTFFNNEDVMRVLIEQLAEGKVQTVLQFLNEIAPTGRTNTRRLMSTNTDRVLGLIPDAFALAMEQRRYGIAAALSQLPDARVSRQDTNRTLELAILHQQRITLEWAHQLIV